MSTKTNLTKQIEQDLKNYSPVSFAGVRIDKFRDSHLAFEVPVVSGDVKGGLIDALRIDEAFLTSLSKEFVLLQETG